jgi:hypothetical protein
VAVKILANFPIRESAHPERLSVVSGEPGIVEVAGKVKEKDELPVASRQFGCLAGCRDELDGGAEALGGATGRLWGMVAWSSRGEASLISHGRNSQQQQEHQGTTEPGYHSARPPRAPTCLRY